MTAFFNVVPNEVMLEICRNLATNDRISFMKTSKRCKEIISIETLWSGMELIWKDTTESNPQPGKEKITLLWYKKTGRKGGRRLVYHENLLLPVLDSVWLVTRSYRAKVEKWRGASSRYAIEKMLINMLSERHEEETQGKRVILLQALDLRYIKSYFKMLGASYCRKVLF